MDSGLVTPERGQLIMQELGEMEDWLQERARIIKPLTDDCAGIEEENRQLEQQWKSYDALGQELRRLLAGLDVVLRHLEAALRRDVVLFEVGGAHAEPLDVGRRQVDRVVRHVLRALHVHREDLEAVPAH